jgi:hypothetical protein
MRSGCFVGSHERDYTSGGEPHADQASTDHHRGATSPPDPVAQPSSASPVRPRASEQVTLARLRAADAPRGPEQFDSTWRPADHCADNEAALGWRPCVALRFASSATGTLVVEVIVMMIRSNALLCIRRGCAKPAASAAARPAFISPEVFRSNPPRPPPSAPNGGCEVGKDPRALLTGYRRRDWIRRS